MHTSSNLRAAARGGEEPMSQKIFGSFADLTCYNENVKDGSVADKSYVDSSHVDISVIKD